MSSTTAWRRPRIRFTRVDLPTFGRPTTATTGTGPSSSSALAASTSAVNSSASAAQMASSVTCFPVAVVEQSAHAVDDFFDTESGGVEDDGAGCGLVWFGGFGVGVVAACEVGGRGGDVGVVLGAAPAGAFGFVGGEVDLEVGVGCDHFADVDRKRTRLNSIQV